MPKAEALREAKDWLRRSAEQAPGEVLAQERGLRGPNRKLPKVASRVEPAPAGAVVPRRFAHPYYWAGFILIGDPW